MSKISDEIFQASTNFLKSSDKSQELNILLNQYIKWPMKADKGIIKDHLGTSTDEFNTVIFSDNNNADSDIKHDSIDASNCACVIDLYEILDKEQLHAAYKKISKAKRLAKSSAKGQAYVRTETFGVILASTSKMKLEEIASEIEILNAQTSFTEWVDVVAILNSGTISYACQFPGEMTIGAFMLPSKDKIDSPPPAFYILPIISPTHSFTLNKVLALIFAHLGTFSPGSAPNMNEVSESTPKHLLTMAGFQFNTKGELCPVPPNQYIGRYIPAQGQLLLDKKTKKSFKIFLIPWQDGGVIILSGNYKLANLLSILKQPQARKSSVINRPNLQISDVLTISEHDYIQLLLEFQQKTNYQLQKPNSGVRKKLADKGTQDPFISRLFIGIMTLRNSVFKENPAKKDEFDTNYESVIMDLWSLHDTAGDIKSLISTHLEEIQTESGATINDSLIHVKNTIDRKLKKEVKSFINEASRIFKQDMQRILKSLGQDISLLYQKDHSFETSLAALKSPNPLLANYIEKTRLEWSANLSEVRINLEHNLWNLDDLVYTNDLGKVKVILPKIKDMNVNDFIDFIMDRLTCFVEDMIVYSLQSLLPNEFGFIEKSLGNRNHEIPERFRVGLTIDGIERWGVSAQVCK